MGQGGTIRSSKGSVSLKSFHSTGFSADMPVGPGKHRFEAVYTPDGIQVTGTVIMEGKAVGTYTAHMKKTDSDLIPVDSDGPPDSPGGPPPMHP